MTTTTSRTDTIRLRSRIPATSITRHVDTLRLPGGVALIEREAQLVGDAPSGDVVPLDGDDCLEVRPGSQTDGLDLGPDLRLVVQRPSRRQRFAIRTLDLIVAIVGLVVLAPLMILVAVAVMLDSPGPILYGSTRVGHAKPTFRAWKFRSMKPNAEVALENLLADDDEAREEYEAYHKLRNDPRLTRVGAVIRQTSLDELPQLLNILVGEMSVVGPRPKLTKDAESYGEALATVLTVKPGLTGLWQVSGRNRLPMAERVALDVRYVVTRSLIGDLRICVKTFVQLWQPQKHGAY